MHNKLSKLSKKQPNEKWQKMEQTIHQNDIWMAQNTCKDIQNH
jgi:hypothetical protein